LLDENESAKLAAVSIAGCHVPVNAGPAGTGVAVGTSGWFVVERPQAKDKHTRDTATRMFELLDLQWEPAARAAMARTTLRASSAGPADNADRMKSLAAFFSALSLGMCPQPVIDRGNEQAPRPNAAQERADFTAALAAFYKDTRFVHWLDTISHGSEDRAFAAYWPGVTVVKRGDAVTYRHDAWADNLMIPSSRILGQMSALYLWTGDATAGGLAARYAEGLSATMLGMQWDQNDPVQSLMARAVIPQSHTIVRSGRSIAVDYEALRKPRSDWNTETVADYANPYWPGEWVQTIRSKDDLPHVFLAATVLPHLHAFAPDAAVRQSAGAAYDLLRGFAKDVAEHEWWMRSRHADGTIYYPGLIPSDKQLSDLANFEMSRVYPKGECDARVSLSLVGYDDAHGEDCGDGLVRWVDLVATEANFYNYLILSTFHLSATALAVEQGKDAMAAALKQGLSGRVDFDINLQASEVPGGDLARWRRELSLFVVYAAAAGMDTPPGAAYLAQQHFTEAIGRLRGFAGYDLDALPDGDSPLHPDEADEIGAFFWYCWSPYRGGGSAIVDCPTLKALIAE
jgi:hypothetical protein